MSRWHANDTWQSADGTWSTGFYEAESFPEDPDDEWGVEFDRSTFQWVSGGHATPEQSWEWPGPNPGSHDITKYNADDPDSVRRCTNFDVIAAELEDSEQERRSKPGMSSDWMDRYSTFTGPSKANQRPVMQARLNKLDKKLRGLDREQAIYQLQGYANDNSRDRAEVALQRDQLRSRAIRAGLDEDTDRQCRDDIDNQERLTTLREIAAKEPHFRSDGRGTPTSVTEARTKLAADLAAAEKAEAARVKAANKTAVGAKLYAKRTMAAIEAPSASTNSSRVSRGVPTGGQFAARQRAESDVEL